MTTSNYADVVWVLDALLLVAVVLLVAGGLIHAMTVETKHRKRQPGETALKDLFQKLDGLDALTVGQEIAAISSRLTTADWIWLVNQHETVVPDSVWPQVASYLRSSTMIVELEQRAAHEKNKWQRIEATKCIGHISSPTALEILGQNLDEQDDDIQYFAMLALSYIRTPAAAQIMLKFLTRGVISGHKVVAALEAFPATMLPDVYRTLEDADEKSRFWLLKLLSTFKPKEAVPVVVKYTADTSADVRAAACECLGAVGSAEARDALQRCVQDEVWYVRLQAVRALARILGVACLPQLLPLLGKEPSVLVQESIKSVLTRDEKAVLSTTEDLLSQEDQTVKAWCVNALVDSNNVIKLLAQCIAGPAQERERAVSLLKKLIQSNIHFGLKETLAQFQPEARRRLLAVVGSIDSGLAERMEPEVPEGM